MSDDAASPTRQCGGITPGLAGVCVLDAQGRRTTEVFDESRTASIVEVEHGVPPGDCEIGGPSGLDRGREATRILLSAAAGDSWTVYLAGIPDGVLQVGAEVELTMTFEVGEAGWVSQTVMLGQHKHLFVMAAALNGAVDGVLTPGLYYQDFFMFDDGVTCEEANDPCAWTRHRALVLHGDASGDVTELVEPGQTVDVGGFVVTLSAFDVAAASLTNDACSEPTTTLVAGYLAGTP